MRGMVVFGCIEFSAEDVGFGRIVGLSALSLVQQ